MQPSRRKWMGRFLTSMTWALVAIHLIPIAWMVYCGVKDNQEILSGKVLPGRRQNEVVFLHASPAGWLAGTADGGLTLFDKRLERQRHLELGTFATAYLADPARNALWVLSSNRGLQEVDPASLKLRATYGIDAIAKAHGDAWSTLWVNEVPGSALARSGDTLFLSWQFPSIPGVTAFSIKDRAFRPSSGFPVKEAGVIRHLARASEADPFSVLTARGIWSRGDSSRPARAGRLPVVPDRIVALDSRRLLLSSDARAFLYDTRKDTVLAWLDRVPGGGRVTAFAASPGRIWLGDSRGAQAVPDTFAPADSQAPAATAVREIPGGSEDSLPPAAAVEYRPRFPHADGRADDLTSRRITAILPLEDGGVLLGGPNGALSALDASGAPTASGSAPAGAIYLHWRNYIDLWRNIDFGLYLKNSFIICVGVMLVAMVLASMGGYALARYNFPGKNLFGYSVLATQMVPGIMLLIPLYLMFISFGRHTGLIIKGTYGGLILTYAAYFVPFSIWILRGFFASLPKELEEAALVDGCGPIQAFFRIIIPSALPGIIATGVFVFLSAWDELMFAWVLTDERTYTIPVGIRLFVGNFQNRYDLMMAAATASTIPVMILFFIMQRHIVSGLTAGAVKE